MKVLSLFDGMSCGMQALKQAGIFVERYDAYEIDKYAISVSRYNHPEINHCGDVLDWENNLPVDDYDLILAGSPCQAFSFAGDQLAFDDPRGQLFFVFARILEHVRGANPDVKFLLENVVMAQKHQDVITGILGVEPVKLNSALVSAQNRNRLYWANFPIQAPDDTKTALRDVLLADGYPVALSNVYGGFSEKQPRVHTGKAPTIRTAAGGGHIPSLLHSPKAVIYMCRQVADGRTHWDFNHHSDTKNEKSSAVVANFYKGVPYNVLKDNGLVRKFHPIECERLQTLPDNYTAKGVDENYNWSNAKPISNTQRYKMIGNGWTVSVIEHIFTGLWS